MFDTLDSIPWAEVRHAYGPATDAPGWLRALDSDDEDLRGEAIMHFLFSSATHQYTLYPATPFIIPFVIEALGSSTLVQRSSGFDRPMGVYLLEFLRSCSERGQRGIYGKPHPKAPTIEQAIATGLPIYEMYASDSASAFRDDAAWLARFAVIRSTA